MSEENKEEIQEETAEQETPEETPEETPAEEAAEETAEAAADEAAEEPAADSKKFKPEVVEIEVNFKKPLDKMTAIELREVAMEIPGVTGVHAMKKEEILALIKEAWDIEDEETVKEKKTRSGRSVQELKGKIASVKEEKKAARESKDQKKVEVLRRRINRLKKQTRKAAKA